MVKYDEKWERKNPLAVILFQIADVINLILFFARWTWTVEERLAFLGKICSQKQKTKKASSSHFDTCFKKD